MKKAPRISSSFSLHPSSFFAPGFSLIELMLVIAIMAVLAAMAAPRYAGAINRYRADAAAKRIAADFTMAQSRARSLGVSRSVAFTRSNNTYQIAGEQHLNKPSQTYAVNLTHDPYFAALGTVTFGTGGLTTITFNGYGIPDNAGYVTVIAGDVTKKISIDADSGVVTIQ